MTSASHTLRLNQPLAQRYNAVRGQTEALAAPLQHEQQHQELLLTDLLHLLSCNPLMPVYQARWPLASVASLAQDWVGLPGGLVEIGDAAEGFCFDNETPRSHIRSSYRNFFPTDTRWQFNGLRLARDES